MSSERAGSCPFTGAPGLGGGAKPAGDGASGSSGRIGRVPGLPMWRDVVDDREGVDACGGGVAVPAVQENLAVQRPKTIAKGAPVFCCALCNRSAATLKSW
ncbi:hypothetical protein [Streptomyces sp. 2A115]|uniref:hypothetical protein n=1 Tax=Streptomyces sp. 2A115 TaxID=3457439 RepID=UPI003FD5D4B1